ncbi:ABC transporter permease [Spirochaetia bacterium]|nr:ABC transporter permease [Spirochaetia bacterium]GHV22114.1 ABC transporter permease [Spirochaetia bacterium]
MIETIIIEGLIYGIMVLGVFITFRVLDFADLTVDGSFALGGSVTAALLLRGAPSAAIFLAVFVAGCLAGLATALIHSKLKVPGLLAGFLTMTMLYSVNLRIQGGRSNISFLKLPTMFSKITDFAARSLPDFLSGGMSVLLFLLLVTLAFKILIDIFFRTDFGLAMGALGSNPQLIVSQGMDPEVVKAAGICIANGLTAVAGALASMYNGFADVGSGTGVVLAGLAAVMIGEFLMRSNRIALLTLRVLLGSILYRALMLLARIYGWRINMGPNDLKFVTGALIIICLIVTQAKLPSKLSKRGRQ